MILKRARSRLGNCSRLFMGKSTRLHAKYHRLRALILKIMLASSTSFLKKEIRVGKKRKLTNILRWKWNFFLLSFLFNNEVENFFINLNCFVQWPEKRNFYHMIAIKIIFLLGIYASHFHNFCVNFYLTRNFH